MPESPLHLLFTQLQSRYPTSGLITELVHSDVDRAVVRALVQVGTMTLATSMAAAPTVEQAEDQARLRVLALLGINSTAAPSSALSHYSPSPLTTAIANHDQAFDRPTPVMPSPLAPTIPHPATGPLDERLAIDPMPPVTPSLPDTVPGLASVPLPVANGRFEPTIADVPFSASEVEPDSMPLYSPTAAFDTFDPIDEGDMPFETASFEEPLAAVTESEDAETTSSAASESRPATVDADPVSQPDAPSMPAPAKPRKSGVDHEPSTVDNSAAPAASRDLSSLISQIGVEIDRIGWSKRQGSTYLQKTYGKKTRGELTDDELEDFLHYLSTQPTAG